MINPMIYITFNDNFKKAFKKVIFCSNEEIPSEHSSNVEYLLRESMIAAKAIL